MESENEKEIARIEVVMHKKTEGMHGASIKESGSNGDILQLLEDLTGSLVEEAGIPAEAVLIACTAGVLKGLKTHEADS